MTPRGALLVWVTIFIRISASITSFQSWVELGILNALNSCLNFLKSAEVITKPRTSCLTRHARVKTFAQCVSYAELCPSGRRSTLGKRVMVKAIQEFESLQLRHLLIPLHNFLEALVCSTAV
jgi:hypothetical protein